MTNCFQFCLNFAFEFNLRRYNLVPVICSYLAGDVKKIQKAIILGSSAPLLMFLSWDAVALGLAGAGGGGGGAGGGGFGGDPLVGRCRLKPGEARVESALVMWMGKAPYGPLFPHSDLWGRPPAHHSSLESKM
jgi:hypothetical protein